MIADATSFAAYVERVFERTRLVAAAVPADKLDWLPKADELTCGDIIRHIASTRLMNVRAVANGVMRYDGHSTALGRSHDDVLAYLDHSQREVGPLLLRLDPTRLATNVPGQWQDVPGWRRLMGMVEHEIHHRSQLCSYLTQLGLNPPALFGIYVENLPQ